MNRVNEPGVAGWRLKPAGRGGGRQLAGWSQGKAFPFIVLFLIFVSPLFAKTPKNVVALSKSVAELWTLSGGTIAGTTDDALELPGAENAVSVGTLTTASLEAILSVNPELVILTLDIPLHKTLNNNLKNLGIKTYIADVKSFGDYEKVMTDFTKLTGRKDLYQKNVADVKNQINSVKDDYKGKSSGTYYFVRVSAAKNKVLKNHFGNEIFADLGLESIIEDDSLLDELSVEELLAKNPDFIFVVMQGNEKKAVASFKAAYESNPVWKELIAVKNGKVVVLPKDLFNYKPNARWAEAYDAVIRNAELGSKN